MNLPKNITTLQKADIRTLSTIVSLAATAAKIEQTRKSDWDKYEALKLTEPKRAAIVARSLNGMSGFHEDARERFALAQVLCLVGGGIQRGKFSDSQVFDSQGDKGDAEWTARARANVREIAQAAQAALPAMVI